MPFLGVTYTRTFIGSPARRERVLGTALSLSQMGRGATGAPPHAYDDAARSWRERARRSGRLAPDLLGALREVVADLVRRPLELLDVRALAVDVGAVVGGVAGHPGRLLELHVGGAHHLRRAAVEIGAVRAVDGGRHGVAYEVLFAGGEDGIPQLKLFELRPLSLDCGIGHAGEEVGNLAQRLDDVLLCVLPAHDEPPLPVGCL